MLKLTIYVQSCGLDYVPGLANIAYCQGFRCQPRIHCFLDRGKFLISLNSVDLLQPVRYIKYLT